MKSKSIPQKITALQLVRILNQAKKSTTLSQIPRLFVEKQRLREAVSKLREKQKANAEAIKNATTQKTPEQFLFRF